MGRALTWLVEAVATDTDACLLYPFTPSQRYGLVYHQGRQRLAHVVALELAGRPLQPGQEARHRCGVARCCNPRHLRGGTHAENEADKHTHGTVPDHQGEANPNARLTAADVRAIRASTDTHRALAARYGVNRRSIGAIRARQRWAHVA